MHAARAALAARLDLPDPHGWVWLRQVHGAHILHAGGPTPSPPPEADGAVTTRAGLPLAVVTADCAPVALLAPEAVGVVHAGWPGLEAGVVEAGVTAMRAAGASEVRAVLGPCARPEHYEFGEDLLDRLVGRFGPEVATTTRAGRPALDIPAAVRVALARHDVELEDLEVDTIAEPDHFSHRREGTTGRQALVVVRRMGS